jgi:hypothetical protein
MSLLDRVLGPKVPREEMQANQARYWTPKVLFTVSALLLMVSILFPYWVLDLTAPQYPDGLRVQAFVNRLEGDVNELEELNHYIGLPSFADGAQLERSVSIAGIIALAGLLLAGLYIHSRWVLVFALPAVLFPLIFMVDLQYWLWRYGHDLDPRAPLTGAVGEFTPPILGPADIANFTTKALPGPGLYIAVLASIVTVVGLWYHRRAYKPLVDEIRAGRDGSGSGSSPDAATA